MTRTCRCGKWMEDVEGPGGWRVTTDGPGNALTWWCPACWAERLADGLRSTTGQETALPNAVEPAGQPSSNP